MDQSVTIGAADSTAVDSGGSPVVDFSSTTGPFIARIWPVSGSENVRAGRPASQTVYNVVIDPAATVTAEDRINWGSRVLKLLEPKQDAGSQGVIVKLIAEEVSI